MITMNKAQEENFKKTSDATEGMTLLSSQNAELKEAKESNIFYAALVRSIYMRLASQDVEGAIRLLCCNFLEPVKCRTCNKDIIFTGKNEFDLRSEDWGHIGAPKDDHRPRPEGYGFKKIQAFNAPVLIQKIKELQALVANGSKQETEIFLQDFSDAVER